MTNFVYKNGDTVKLILMSQQGDIKAIESLIRREQKHIYAIFAHLVYKKDDVSDLTQETLLKVAKNINKLKEPVKFRQWLNKIIANTFYDYAKKNKLEYVELNNSEFEEIKDKVSCEPGEKCIFSELENLIRSALVNLPKHLRLSLILREYEGLSYEDISKLTNATLGTVKSRISRARLKLRKELDGYI